MDIIGKIYRDFFVDQYSLNGKSYSLNKYKLGGIGNIFDIEKIFKNAHLCNNKFFIISNNKINEQEIINIAQGLEIKIINVDCDLPSALIVEKNGSRTSFVLDDVNIRIESLLPKSKEALLFYGDKISLPKNIKYQKLFIDTAGNEYKDLFFKFNDISDEIFVSISDEYLDNKLIEFYLSCNYKIISHKPTKTRFITNDGIFLIENKYFKQEFISNVTGLGDKFFTIFASKYVEDCVKPKEAIEFAQEEIIKFI